MVCIAIASGLGSGAVAASETNPNRLEPGALTGVKLSGTVQEYAFTPSANGQYAVYLFPLEDGAAASAELYQDGECIASVEGVLKVLSLRLNADGRYALRLTGSGAVLLEIARESLSRCFDQPLELDDGEGYAKLIARGGDAHWYAVAANRDGAAILAAQSEESDLRLQAWLFDEGGRLIATSDGLESGACAMSAEFVSGGRYYVRVAAAGMDTGKYVLSVLRSAVTAQPESVRLSAEALTLQGRSRAVLRAETLPAGVCPLVFYTSTRPETAAIHADGSVRGKQPGTASVIAYAYGGVQAACEVTVERVAVEGVRLTAGSLSLTVGETAALTVTLSPENASERGVTFVTESDRVVSVDAEGTLTAVGEGTARVIAITADGGHTDMITVTVAPARRRYRALLVGEQNYASTVDSLRPGSILSVESVASLLKTASFEGEGFAVQTLLDAPRDEVIAGIREAFAGATESDVSLLYITCHGFYQAGMTFFVMADGSVLSAADLERELRSVPGQIVLLADCCGSGGLMAEAGSAGDILDGVTSVFQGSVGGASVHGSKYRVLASALLDQDSYRISFSGDGEEGMATVFARALCDAAGWSIDRSARSSMNADADYDGEITLQELESYLSRRVMWYLNLAGGYVQTVRAYPEGDGTVIFARTAE